jgi:predicted Zn-dependent protease
VNLAALHVALGELSAAGREFETALRVGPYFAPAYVNYADLKRQLGRDDEGEPLLRSALALAPDSATTQHALGLLLVRRKRLDEALTFLARAVELAPEQPRYVYVYAVALHSAGEPARAREVLHQAARRHPDDPTIAAFLAELEAQPGS